jgi:hypothetical protein
MALSGTDRILTFLFTTEMWERFSFYGMRALLVLYMVKYLLLSGHGDVVGLGAARALCSKACLDHSARNPSHRGWVSLRSSHTVTPLSLSSFASRPTRSQFSRT